MWDDSFRISWIGVVCSAVLGTFSRTRGGGGRSIDGWFQVRGWTACVLESGWDREG